MEQSAQCGQENPVPYYTPVKSSYPIGKKTQSINWMEEEKKMAYVPGEPKHEVKCARCGVTGVLFTKIKNPKTGKEDWYCTANCALKATDFKGRGVGGNHVKQQSPVSKEDMKMSKKNLKKTEAQEPEEEETPEEETPSKKGKDEKKKGKGKLGEHLTPKEPVIFPKELLKHPEIGEALKVLTTCDRSSREGSKARLALRNKGFKLSDEATWKPFLKRVSR